MTLLHNNKNQMEMWQLSKENHQIFSNHIPYFLKSSTCFLLSVVELSGQPGLCLKVLTPSASLVSQGAMSGIWYLWETLSTMTSVSLVPEKRKKRLEEELRTGGGGNFTDPSQHEPGLLAAG